MKKIIALGFLLLLAAWVVGSCFLGQGSAKPPSVEVAPYRITTPSRVYYAKEVEGFPVTLAKDLVGSPPDVVIIGYYELIGKRWIYRPGGIRFNWVFGTVRVERR